MANERVKRKISAILSADVVGYSRLMEADEESTVQVLESYQAVITAIIEQHEGRVVDFPAGDNALAEFASVVNAVQCAVEIQKAIKTKNEFIRSIFFLWDALAFLPIHKRTKKVMSIAAVVKSPIFT